MNQFIIGTFIGDTYSIQLLSLVSGMFLYFVVNTVINDLKENKSFINTVFQAVAMILGYSCMKNCIH